MLLTNEWKSYSKLPRIYELHVESINEENLDAIFYTYKR